MSAASLDQLCINTIRTLSIDVIQKADSGHPGLPLGAAPMAYVLWQKHLKHCPTSPKWPDRDRFVLSAGHGSMLLYSLLHLTGYPLSKEEVLNFRQWGSKTPGHPESFLTPGVEATTGPLGQGHANAVGMAIAERALAGRFNQPSFDIVNHYTYCLVGDGDVMEGVAMEAASLAGHLKLGKLICLYDSNDVTLDGPAKVSFTDDVAARYASWGWQVLHVADGNTDLAALDQALTDAKAETQKPTMIIVKTTIGYGSPNKSGKSSSHGSPLGKDEIALTKKALGWNYEEPFFIPPEALENFRTAVTRGESAMEAWKKRFEDYRSVHPVLASEFERVMNNTLPEGYALALPTFPAGKDVETRTAAGQALNALARAVPEIIGGDADLGGSTKTVLKDEGSFNGQSGQGRNIHFGVREHAMASIANGISYHGGLRPFTATFFCFVDYERPAIRLAAMNKLPVVHVWTHDSIGLGEDGPTHQPVEHLASVRAIPGLCTVRPADAAESAEAWKFAIERNHGPTGLVLSRQKLPVFDRTKFGAASGLHQGAYVLAEASSAPKVILIATGSEMQLAMGAREQLEKEGVPTRVVSMPCMEQFRAQSAAYRESVLPAAVKARVSIEAGVTFGWREWVGDAGETIGVDEFGASAPDKILFEQYGLTVGAVVEAARKTLG
ncbi:MAG: transketolase [Archangium gephyra]|uniref:Transketolase n=1 Tax=Archangium gephyra TaxID=48 RepID=A0A2W5T8Y4_9BACT|nr:MAG: transketolase [Archangium gephyra]